jgi:ADP-ribosylglycohydrolase
MTPLQRARRSLEGLSTGDAFGQLFFSISPDAASTGALPAGPWQWTDDTHMALSIVEVLTEHQRINQDALAAAFARRYVENPFRGYAGGAARLLTRLASGADWRVESPALFGGGSYGNGAAMRVAPVGAYFADDPDRAAHEAQHSAVITHAHPEGQAGAIAVAVAAATAASQPATAGRQFISGLLQFVPDGLVRRRLQTALDIPRGELYNAVHTLGSGDEVTAQDTVPFCIWVASHHLDDYEGALWTAARGLGDVDTTCAIVGGIVALSAPAIPAAWIERREPLPAG